IAIAGEYLDDGISGKIPLADRPEGRRLIADAEAGRFGAVLIYNIKRLGRKLRVILDAHDALDALGIAIKSGTEPIDTSTPIGRFIFSLLGSIAELDRETVLEQLASGRDRVVRDGKYTGGVIPFGYDLDADRRYVPSTRRVDALDTTEADLVREIFARVASGQASADAEAQRLNALGIPTGRRYPAPRAGAANGAATAEPRAAATGVWYAGRVAKLIRNPVYQGRLAFRSKNGTITYDVPPLVDAATWEAAGARLTQNRRMAMKNAKRLYLLRGLIRCGACGKVYSGSAKLPGTKQAPDGYLRYRCSGSLSAGAPVPGTRCHSPSVRASDVESAVWSDIKRWADDPGDYLADAQAQLRARMEQSTNAEAQRRELIGQIAGKETERERVLTMYRRGRISIDEADKELDAIAKETATLRELVESLRAQESLTAAAESHLTTTATVLANLKDKIAAIERTKDTAAQREIIELLVFEITVRAVGDGRRRKPEIAIRYALDPARTGAVADTMAPSSSSLRRCR
ncbi:MAG: recombinase family protein, partial [Dehalococcoidia bacterium]